LYLGVEIGLKQQLALCDALGRLLCMVSEKVPCPTASDVQDWLRQQIPPLIGREAEFSGKVSRRRGLRRRAGEQL
jgi:hypothetical protein